MGKYGMAVDNVRSVEVVEATARSPRLMSSSTPICTGACGAAAENFGVATSFEFDAHPVSTVFGGLIAFALPDAPTVWDFFGDFSADAPDELVLMMALVHAPDGLGHKIAAGGGCHCGDLSEGEKAADAICSADHAADRRAMTAAPIRSKTGSWTRGSRRVPATTGSRPLSRRSQQRLSR
jgi:hypothetical protein